MEVIMTFDDALRKVKDLVWNIPATTMGPCSIVLREHEFCLIPLNELHPSDIAILNFTREQIPVGLTPAEWVLVRAQLQTLNTNGFL